MEKADFVPNKLVLVREPCALEAHRRFENWEHYVAYKQQTEKNHKEGKGCPLCKPGGSDDETPQK